MTRRLTRRQRTAAIVLAAIACCFLTLDLGGGSLRGAHAGVRGTFGSLYRGADGVLGPVRRWVQGVPSAGANTGRIDALTARNAALARRVAQLESDARSHGRLVALQRAADGSGNRLLPARVTALGPGQGFDWTITLDAGSAAGVRVGQTVTDGVGLVGRVVHADADSSVVLLATDPGSGVGVRDLRTGELGVATGQGADGLTFVPLRPDATVHVGDPLETGPAGSTTFVPGLSVGTVTAVRSSADGTVRATGRPAASPTSLDVVAVIVADATNLAGRALVPRSP